MPTRFRLRAGNLDTALRYDAVLRLLADRWQPELRVLEVGSGSGGVTEFLAHPVTGVDPAFERTAERTTQWLDRRPGRATALPVADGSFDAVLCVRGCSSTCPATSASAALREMLRALRPGGRLIVTFPADEAALELDRWLDSAYRARHGEPHPWVAEHLAEGLPRTDDVRAALGARRRRRRARARPQASARAGVPCPPRPLHGARRHRADRALCARQSARRAAGVRRAAADAPGAGLSDRARARQAVSVSVVIPTWNGRALLDVALASLERQTLAPDELIVVDNGSSDGTVEHVRSRWPAVERRGAAREPRASRPRSTAGSSARAASTSR